MDTNMGTIGIVITSILVGIAALAALVVAASFVVMLYLIWKKLDDLIEAMEDSTRNIGVNASSISERLSLLTEATKNLHDAIVTSPISTLPAVAEGQSKACLALVDAVLRVEATTEKFGALLIGGDPSAKVPVDRNAGEDREWRVERLMERGISRKQAEARVDSDGLYAGFDLRQ